MSHRLQVLIPEKLDSAIRKAAQRQRYSKGEWVRRALEKALEDEQRQPTDSLDRLAALGAPTGDIDKMLNEIEAGRG